MKVKEKIKTIGKNVAKGAVAVGVGAATFVGLVGGAAGAIAFESLDKQRYEVKKKDKWYKKKTTHIYDGFGREIDPLTNKLMKGGK